MDIHVINLKRDVEKWKLFNTQISTTSLNFKRFDAIDGNALTNDIGVSELCNQVVCNKGIIGCAKSHISLWKQLVESDSNYYIIMEDDAKFDIKQLETALHTIHRYLENKDNLIISLMCIGPFCNIGDTQYIDDYKVVSSLFPLCTTAYIITNGAARHLLNEMKSTVNYHIDFEIAKHVLLSKQVKYLVIVPNIVYVCDDTDSSIGTRNKKSIFFGWSKRIMWYCNVPIWKFGNLYTSILLLLLLIFSIIFFVRCKMIYIFFIILITIELIIFNKC